MKQAGESAAAGMRRLTCTHTLVILRNRTLSISLSLFVSVLFCSVGMKIEVLQDSSRPGAFKKVLKLNCSRVA